MNLDEQIVKKKLNLGSDKLNRHTVHFYSKHMNTTEANSKVRGFEIKIQNKILMKVKKHMLDGVLRAFINIARYVKGGIKQDFFISIKDKNLKSLVLKVCKNTCQMVC